MRRLFGTALIVRGLWLLSAGGVLAGTVLLNQAEDRLTEDDHVAEEKPVRIMPGDTAAIVEQQVPRLEQQVPPVERRAPRGSKAPSSPWRSSLRPRTSASQRASPPKQSQPKAAGKLRVNQVKEDNFIVDGETLRLAIEEVGETLSHMMPEVGAALSAQPRTGLNISSAAGSATIDSQGFTVTRLNLGQGFGLQVGDTIVSVNGNPVNSLESAWRTFRELFVYNRTSNLRLEIYRGGALMYKTHRIAW